MSLQVWLPLNGDLHNQGLCQVNTAFNTTNTILSTPGKIGEKALTTTTGTNDGLNILNYMNTLKTYQQYSMCAWIYMTDVASGHSTTILSSGRWTKTDNLNNCCTFGLYYKDSNNKYSYILIPNTADWNTKISIPAAKRMNLNIWYHIAITYDGAVTKAYINGEYIGQNAAGGITQQSNTTTLRAGSATYTSSYTLNGKINDIRIYDHCLSPKEVEEISKGLVLHYKLSENYSNWLLPNIERTITRSSSGNTFIDYDYYSDLVSCSETFYTVNFYAKGSVSGMSMDIYFRNSSGSAYASTSQITLTTDWQYYSLSLSGSPDQLDLFRVRCFKGTNGNIIYIRNIRLVSNNMPIRNTTIYDCSGYQNNGTVVGTLTAAAGSPRYEIATVFNGDSYSLTPSGSFNWWDFDKGTFCVWMRPAATASGWSGSVGIAGDNDATKKAFDLTYYANSFRITYANTSYTTIATGKTLPVGEWHFCAATIDGNEVKIYFDGELITTSTIDWKTATLPSNLRFQVGVDLPGTNEKFNGSYSDVRFYSTVLTAEQVKELYNTPVSIDSSGKLYTRELKEV